MLRRGMRIRSLGLSALLALSCQRGQKTEPSAGAAASVSGGAARPRVVVSEPLSAASSFELVASADALHLVWAVARPGPGWMSEGELSHDGTFRMGRSTGLAFEWSDAGASTLFGDLFR